jgi:serine/threonine protein kinase
LVDDSGKLYIADFGISVFLAEADNATFNSMHPGNTRWMAPELFMSSLDEEDSEEDSEIQLPQKLTKAGDIYSFGCMMLQVCWVVMILDRVRHS